jgi:hypothetical protein
LAAARARSLAQGATRKGGVLVKPLHGGGKRRITRRRTPRRVRYVRVI